VVALVLRGDHELNAVKAQKLPGVASPLRMATPERDSRRHRREPSASSGRSACAARLYADHAALALADFTCGANERDAHLTGVNWGRDLPEPGPPTCATSSTGDPSPTGGGRAAHPRGIEVGHIFQLGRKYSEA
jgi:prolyl-tRNA synthetase